MPGQASIARLQGRVSIVICDDAEALPIGHVEMDLHGELHQVAIQGVKVAALRFTVVIKSDGKEKGYVGWVNELEEHVIESLGTQADLTVIMAGPDGKLVRNATAPNTLRPVAHFSLPKISELAGNSDWTSAHFAGARAFIEVQDSGD